MKNHDEPDRDLDSSQHEHPRHRGERETHHFHPDQHHHLRDRERLETIRFDSIIEGLDLSEGSHVIDLGCGPGAFLPELSRKVAEAGRVFGVDVSPRMISHAVERIEEEGLENVFLFLNSETEIPLRAGWFDRVLMVFLLHELTHPQAVLKEVRRLLKPGGRVLAVEWKKESSEEGPPLEHRLSSTEVEQWLADAGLAVTRKRDWTRQLYLIVAGPVTNDPDQNDESEGGD